MMLSIKARAGAAGDELYRQIGAFLAWHRLSPDPGHYAFAWSVLGDADGPLGREVAALTDGGVRLSRGDIERLGGQVSVGGEPLQPGNDDTADADGPTTDSLVARTQAQVETFAATMRTMHDETRGFGRDLAASAEAIQRTGEPLGIDDVVRLTGVMLGRVRATERRLEEATRETDELRAKLAEAHGSARRDPLTELPNRRALEEAFADAAPDTPRCLAVCDIDRFKQINDRFGHAVGDRVLKAIGQLLQQRCEAHLVARYGGEEFAILFTGVHLAEARDLLDTAREAVGARRFRVRDTEEAVGTITFSGGVGAVNAGERFDAAFARVDRALYRAKADGRDRVVSAA